MTMLPEQDDKALLAGNKPENKPQSLSSPLMEYQQRIANLTDRVIALEEENAGLQEIKNKLQTDFFSLAQEVAEELLKSAHPELLESINNLKFQVQELQQENTHLITQVKQGKVMSARLAESYDEDSEALGKRIEKLEEQLSQQRKQFAIIQKSFEALSEEKVNLEQENQALKQDKQALAAKLDEANADLLLQKQRVEVLSRQADSAEQDNAKSNRLTENKWAKELAASIEESFNLNQRLEQSESKYNDLVRTFEESQAFYQGLKEELKNTTDELQQERDNNQKNLQSVQEELIARARKISELRVQLEVLEKQNSDSSVDLSKKIAEKEQEIKTLKQEYEKKIQEKESLIQTQHEEKAASQIIISNRDDLITHLRGEIANLQSLVDTNKGEHANVQRQATALEKQLRDSQDELQASRHDFARKIAELSSQKDAAEQKLETSARDLEQLNKKIAEANSNTASDQKTIELLQQEKQKIESDRDAYKLEANTYQQKVGRLTAEYKQAFSEKDSQIANLTHQRAQLESASQTQAQKSLEAQATIERLTARVAQMEMQQREANRKLNVTENDRQRLQQERDKLNAELSTAMEKLSQPAQTPLSQAQANPARVQKRRHAISDSDMGLNEGENLAQQQERPFKIKRLSLAPESKKYGIDDEFETTQARRNTMAGGGSTVIEQPDEPGILGDNISTSSGISQMSTEGAASAPLTRQNTSSSDDSGVSNNDAETPAVAPTPEIMKKQKIDQMLSLLTPETVANELCGNAKLGFLQELHRAKVSRLEENEALTMLPVLNEQLTILSNQHLATYKALLADNLNIMPLSELENVKVLDELLAIQSNSITLKEMATQQGRTHAQNHVNRFQAAAIAKTDKVFEEAAQAVIAARQGALSIAIDAKTLAEKARQNPATKLLASKLVGKVVEAHKANPSDDQQAQARSQINDVFVANQDAIKLAIEQTLNELEDNEQDNQKKSVAIAQLFEKIDVAQVSRALINYAKPILSTKLDEKGYLLNRSTHEQLEQQLNQLKSSDLDVVKKKLEATLIEEKSIEQINTLGKRPDQVLDRLIHTQIDQQSLATQAKEIATKLAQQEIDSYQNKTAQDLENYYQSTHDFIKNATDRLHLTMKDATSRELRDFTREDRNSLENLAELIKNGKLAEKKKQLEKKLKEPELASEDKESYKQAIKSIEGIFQEKENILTSIGRLETIETALNAIIAQNDQDSKQAIVKAQSSSHFFKVITTEKELASAREGFVDKLSLDKNNDIGSVQKKEAHTHDVIEFNAGNTLIEAIRVETKPSLLKKAGHLVKLGSLFKEKNHITLTYKAVKKDHIIEFSVDSVNADTRPSFIKKHIKNIDFIRSSTQSMLEAAQGVGEGRENKGMGIIILNTHDKNWKTRYALIMSHAVLFPKQYMPRVYLEGKYTNGSLISVKSLQPELEKLKDKFIKEYKKQAGSDEHVNSANTQVKLFTPAA